MAIVINGSGTVTGISVGGLPDGIVDAGTLATNSVDSAELVDGSIDNSHLADDAVGLAEMASGTDGNIISYDASGNPVAIATGDDGQVLTSAGAGAPPAFETVAAGGKVLQVIHGTTNSGVSSSSTTYADTGLSATITPATGSKVLVLVSQACGTKFLASAAVYVRIKLFRSTTELAYYPSFQQHYISGWATIDPGNLNSTPSFSHLDSSPGGDGSTALTYKTQFAADDGGVGDTVTVQEGSAVSSMTLIEIGA
jgi:hypothetical protein